MKHRQRQHRSERCGDRRGFRRREGDRRRTRVGLRCMESLYASGHEHGELQSRTAARPGHQLRPL